MYNYEKLKSMSIEDLSEWLDKYVSYDDSPWCDWFDQKYCKNCEEIMCKSPDDCREFPCAYCEIYYNCRFFQDKEDVPDSKEIIKMWLESNEEDI